MRAKRITFNLHKLASALVAVALLGALVMVPGSTPGLASSERQSYIVQGADADTAASLVARFGGTVTARLDIINGVSAMLSPEAAAHLRAEAGILAVSPNAPVHLVGGGDDGDEGDDENETGGLGRQSPATDYADVVGADLVWEQGVTGQGVTVAVVDTGLARHRGLIRSVNNRRGRILAWVDFVAGKRHPRDPNGHGTHIAGIIANSQKGTDGEWNGVAPGVNLVGVRVLDKTGAGTYDRVIQGLQWVVEHKDEYNIRVVNLSLVSPVQSPYWADPLNQAVMRVWASGITVVVAAGNGGPDPMSVGVPGNNPYVITVGAFTDNYTPLDWNDDYITAFSAAGPTLDGFVKPDVMAPGAHMVSTMLPNSYIARHHQANRVANQYFEMAGTSQAAGVVSGVAALVLSQNPDLTPDQVKARIMGTGLVWIDPGSSDALYSMWQQGAGRINAPDAVNADITVAANPGMDLQADLAGTQHYEGFSYYDETTGTFRLRGEFSAYNSAYGTWAGAYGTWAGAYGTWAGAYGTWAGAYGTWAGAYGTWAGAYGTWAGGYGTWAGAYGTWAGAYGTWAGGFTSWAGTYGTWAGGYGTWAGNYADPDFIARFLDPTQSTGYGTWAGARNFIGAWIEEP